jgi:hypothetical protein
MLKAKTPTVVFGFRDSNFSVISISEFTGKLRFLAIIVASERLRCVQIKEMTQEGRSQLIPDPRVKSPTITCEPNYVPI